MDDFGSHFTFAAIIVWLIQRAKSSYSFPWLTSETDKINRGVAIFLSFLSGFGIHFLPLSWNPVTHTLVITVTGLDFYTIAEGVWGTIQTFVMQEMMWHGLVKPSQTPQVILQQVTAREEAKRQSAG